MEVLLPNENRAKAAMAMVWIVGALKAVSFASDYFQLLLIRKAAAGGIISPDDATANDMRQRIIAIVSLAAFIISTVAFILWFRRAYNNLHQKNNFLSYSEGWAAGAWFVPIVNLFRPYQIMREMYVETRRILAEHQVIHMHKLPVSQLGIWWALWICNSISSQVVMRMTLRVASISEFRIATVLSMVDNVIGIALTLITVKVIRNYADTEPLLAEINENPESLLEKVDLL